VENEGMFLGSKAARFHAC